MKLLEVIFRRFVLLLLILFVPLGVSLGIGFITPPSYQAFTNLWALQRYSIIGATGAEVNLMDTPAGTQVTALTELLQSRAFDVAVGQSTNLKSVLKLSAQDLANPQKVDDAYVADISKNVQVVSKGTNLYEITYTNSDPRIAVQVLKAVVTQFQSQGQQFNVIEGQRFLEQDEAQLATLQNDLNTAVNNESAYLTSHPGSSIMNDPQYALLDGQRLQAQGTLQSMQTTISTLKQAIASQSSSGGAFFKTLDPPQQPDTALSRSKVLLTAGGIGAAIGILACILYIVVLLRRDRSLYSARDVEKITTYPVIMQIPQVSKDVGELFISGAR